MKPEKNISFDQFVSLSYQPFDSEIFGFPFFRLTNLRNSFPCELKALSKLNFPSFGCDAKVLSTDLTSITSLLREGFVHVCDQITLQTSPTKTKFKKDSSAKEVSSLSKLILSSHANNFHEDRLSRDSRISNETVGRFYSKWISNSFSYTNKKVYSLASGLCITQIKQDTLKIDILSVLEKRKGFGTRITGHILAHAAETQVPRIEVTTESDNKGALKTYSRNGFQEKQKVSCFHFFHSKG